MIGPPHGRPKSLSDQVAECLRPEGKRSAKAPRRSLTLKLLVRPFGRRCSACRPWPTRPTRDGESYIDWRLLEKSKVKALSK